MFDLDELERVEEALRELSETPSDTEDDARDG